MLLTYLPLIMLGQLLSVSLLLNIILFRQNRKLTRPNPIDEKIINEKLIEEIVPIVEIACAELAEAPEDHTIFIQQPIFKPQSLFGQLAQTHQSIAEAPLPTQESNVVELPTIIAEAAQVEKKSTVDDINRLLHEIAKIEDQMGLKDKAEA